MARGRFNIGFLVIEAVVFVVLAGIVTHPRRTPAGNALLADLRTLFAGLKDRAGGFRPYQGGSDFALLAGGVIAAPIAAWLVRHLPARVLGVAAGGLIILTNTKTIAEALGATGGTVGLLAAVVAVLWISGIAWAVAQERKAREVARHEEVYVGA